MSTGGGSTRQEVLYPHGQPERGKNAPRKLSPNVKRLLTYCTNIFVRQPVTRLTVIVPGISLLGNTPMSCIGAISKGLTPCSKFSAAMAI